MQTICTSLQTGNHSSTETTVVIAWKIYIFFALMLAAVCIYSFRCLLSYLVNSTTEHWQCTLLPLPQRKMHAHKDNTSPIKNIITFVSINVCLHTAEFRTGDIRPVAAHIPADETDGIQD